MPDNSLARRARLLGLAGFLAIALLVGGGIVARATSKAEEAAFARDNALPTVELVSATPATPGVIKLPGTLEADNEAELHARASGYIARRLVDIGDHVRAGQVLAILDAPEIEQQLEQAQADLRTAQANRALAETTAERWEDLRAKDAVSQQEADEKRGQLAAATALASAATANVERLRATLGFTRIVAPFAGTVTSRTAEIGALVGAGPAGAPPLFTLADDSRLRLRVRVPQALAGSLVRGSAVQLSVPEHPGETFSGTLVRTAGAVDRASGTVLAEFAVDNRARRLRSGGYAEVAISVLPGAGTVSLPASALITSPKGTMVAIVDGNGKVAMRPVTIGRDEGATVHVVAGLPPQAQVVRTPPEALAPGDLVRVVSPRRSGADNAAG